MILAVDTETTGTDFLHGCRPFMITACDGSSNYYWEGQVNPYTREVYWDQRELDEVKELMEEAHHLVFHNTNFDLRALASIGFNIKPYWPKVEDTLIAAHVINAAHDTGNNKKDTPVGRSLGLKSLAVEYLKYWDDDEKELEQAVKAARDNCPSDYRIARKGDPMFPGAKKNFHKMDYWLVPDVCRKYACGDVERTLLLWKEFKPSMIGDGLWEAYKLRKDLLRICYNIVSEGIDFDVESATTFIESTQEEMERLRWEMKEIGGINYKFSPSKPAHVADFIHNKCGIPVLFRTDNDAPKLDKHAIAYYTNEFDHDGIKVLKQWKEREARYKAVKSYLEWVGPDDKIHSNLNPTGTRETRQSSSEPNQQNVTGELEQFYEPEDGWCWFDADFDNIEMRIWAYAVNNEELTKLFDENRSYHMFVFHELFPEEARVFEANKNNKDFLQGTPRGRELAKLYRKIKELNFGIIYGSSGKSADEKIGIPGTYNRLVTRIPEIDAFTKRMISEVFKNHEEWGIPCIFTLGGYRLPVPLDKPYKACNYYVQGSAGIITTKAMQRIDANDDYIDSGSRMFNQVHDSIKIKIRDCSYTKHLCNVFIQEMEAAGNELIKSCTASYEIKYPKPPF